MSFEVSMRSCSPRLLAASVFLALALPAAADDYVLPELSPSGRATCFGRLYNEQHMAVHPHQKTQRIFLLHGLDPLGRPNEEPRLRTSPFQIPYTVFIATTMRGETTPKWARAWCYWGSSTGPDKGLVYCVKECGRQMGFFKLDLAGNLNFTDLPRDFYVDACSDQSLDSAEYARRSFDVDDDHFSLAPQSLDACKAEFARIDPPDPALGPPLRERLKPDQSFCYGQDYDAAHLKAHPNQITTSIRVFRGPTEIESYVGHSDWKERWPADVEIMVRATTRKGGKFPMEERITCKGEGDEWYCDPSYGVCIFDAVRPIYLRRGFNGAILLSNPKSGLPIVDMCAPEGKGLTRSDDRIYRLNEMPLSACGL
jgi:hypothetical protein